MTFFMVLSWSEFMDNKTAKGFALATALTLADIAVWSYLLNSH